MCPGNVEYSFDKSVKIFFTKLPKVFRSIKKIFLTKMLICLRRRHFRQICRKFFAQCPKVFCSKSEKTDTFFSKIVLFPIYSSERRNGFGEVQFCLITGFSYNLVWVHSWGSGVTYYGLWMHLTK